MKEGWGGEDYRASASCTIVDVQIHSSNLIERINTRRGGEKGEGREREYVHCCHCT